MMRAQAAVALVPGRTYLRILGTVGVTFRHCGQGVGTSSGNVVSWTDQILGATETAPAVGQRPAYAADGSNFAAKTTIQANFAATKFLRGTGLSGLPGSGVRPYLFGVFRSRSAPSGGGFPVLASIGTSTASEIAIQQHSGTGLTNLYYAGVTLPGPANDTQQHFISGWADGVNAKFRVDATVYSSVSAVATANASDRSASGQGTAGAVDSLLKGDTTVVLKGIASQYPGAERDAELRALARAEFNF